MKLDTVFFEVGSEAEVLAQRDFYRRHFGMTLLSGEDADDYVFLTDGTVRLGFLFDERPLNPEVINIGFTVDDLEAEVARLEGEGVVFTVPPETFTWARAAAFQDPSRIGGWLIQKDSWSRRP